MKKMMVLAVLGLFLFGCDSDEEGGCTTNADCAEGEMCDFGAVEAATDDDEEEGGVTDAAAAEAAAAGGDIAGAAAGSLLGGDDTAAGTCRRAAYRAHPRGRAERAEQRRCTGESEFARGGRGRRGAAVAPRNT